MNLYVFVQNDGVNYIDLLGEDYFNFIQNIDNKKYRTYLRAIETKCRVIEKLILSQMHSRQEKDSLKHYFGGTSIDVNLSKTDMKSLLDHIPKYKQKIKKLENRCKHSKKGWKKKVETIEGHATHPWALNIGGVSINLEHNCKCKCLLLKAKINDYYDFDVKWIKGDFSRSFKAELKTIGMAILDNVICSDCGWAEYYNKGEYSYECKKK